jgi:hypothetical protein
MIGRLARLDHLSLCFALLAGGVYGGENPAGTSLFQPFNVSAGTNGPRHGVSVRIGPKQEATAAFDTARLNYLVAWAGGPELLPKLVTATNLTPVILVTDLKPGWIKALPTNAPASTVPTASPSKYQGLHVCDSYVVLQYVVNDVPVFELPDYDPADKLFSRTLSIGPTTGPSQLLVCRAPTGGGKRVIVEKVGTGKHGYVVLGGSPEAIAVAIEGAPKEIHWQAVEDHLYLRLPALTEPANFRLTVWRGDNDEGVSKFVESLVQVPPLINPSKLAKAAGAQWHPAADQPK